MQFYASLYAKRKHLVPWGTPRVVRMPSARLVRVAILQGGGPALPAMKIKQIK
jgi:hypothetical protein